MALLSHGSYERFYNRYQKVSTVQSKTSASFMQSMFTILQKLSLYFPFTVSFDKFQSSVLLVKTKIQLQNRLNKSLAIYGQRDDKESQEPSAPLGAIRSGPKVEVLSLGTHAPSPCKAWCKMKASADSQRYNYHQGGGIIKVRIIYLEEDKN